MSLPALPASATCGNARGAASDDLSRGRCGERFARGSRAVYRKFLSSDAAFYNSFNVQHHLVSAKNHLAFRAESMDMWREAATTA